MVLLIQDIDFTDEIQADVLDPAVAVTGVVGIVGYERRLDLLMQLAPDTQSLHVFHDGFNPTLIDTLRLASESYGVTMTQFALVDRSATEAALASIPDDTDAIMLDANTSTLMQQVGELALRRKWPVAGGTDTQQAGIMISYTARLADVYAVAARLLSAVLDGTPTADLPFEYVEPVLVVDVATANAIGIEIPDAVIAQAHTVFRDPIPVPTTASTTAPTD